MTAPGDVSNDIWLLRNDGTTKVAVLANAFSAIATEQLLDDAGGEATITFSLPLSDPKTTLIQNEMCVRVTTNVSDPNVSLLNALDEVYTVRTATDGYQDDGTKVFTVYAEARWYDLDTLDLITIPIAVNTAQAALDVVLANTGWTRGVVNVAPPAGAVAFASTDLITPLAALRALPAIFGGELSFDTVNKQVNLLARRGNQTANLMYTRAGNMASDVRTIDTTGLTTRVHPVGANGIDITTVNNNVTYLEDYSFFDQRGMARQVRAQKIENDNINDPIALLAWAKNQLTTMAKPAVTYAIKITLLAGKAFPHLGDLVRVVDPTLALDTYARVSRREVDVVQPWNTVLTIDTALYTLATPGGGTGLPTGSTGVDTTVPNPPTNLRLEFGSGLDPNGNWNTYGVVVFDPPTANSDGTPITDLDHFDVEIKPEGASQWTPIGASSNNSIGIGYIPSLELLTVHVRAVDHSNNRSAWTEVAAVVPLPSPFYLPPSTPILDANRLPLCIEVVWNGLDNNNVPYPHDVDNIEVHLTAGVVASFTPSAATLHDVIPARDGGFVDPLTNLDPGSSYTVCLVAVGRLNTKSKPSVAVSATVQPVGPTHLVYNGDQDNLVPDGSFETEGGQARLMADPSWTSAWSFVDAAHAPGGRGASAIAHGAFALMGTGGTLTGRDRSLVLISTATTSNEKLWAKVRYWNALTGGGATFGIVAYDSSGAVIETHGLTLPATTGYQLQSFTYTLPAACTTYAFYVQMTSSVSGGFLFVDAVELRTVIQTAIIDRLAVTDAQIASLDVGSITGGTLQFDFALAARIWTSPNYPRVELGSSGLWAYNSFGINTVRISNDGSASFTGTVSGSTIIGSTIIGGLIETATTGNRVVIDGDTGGGRAIKFYSGSGGETSPAGIGAASAGGVMLTTANGASDSLWLGAGLFRLITSGSMTIQGPGGSTGYIGGYSEMDMTANTTLYLPVGARLGTGPHVMASWGNYQFSNAGQSYQATDANGYADIAHGLGGVPQVVIGTCQFPIGGVANIPVAVMTDGYGSINFRARFFDQNGNPYAGKFVTLNWFANG